uniref:Uncharacterized protein n=1 Tax=Lactuca sativa TaxID=4236 RepID=A0A9R1USU3_LACSA|nr:hypothetical protein LSAT_V11C800394610 [Lactuca sativa]
MLYGLNKTKKLNMKGQLSMETSRHYITSLYFINCNRQTLVTMDVRTKLYNIDHATTKDYLSAGLTVLDYVRYVYRMHLLMALLLVITSAHFIYAAVEQHYVKVAGTTPHPHGWDAIFYMFQLIRTGLFFTVIMLIGIGRCLWKPFWKGMDTLILMILMDVILLQVLGNVASIKAGETNHYGYDYWKWKAVFFLSDYGSCVITLLENKGFSHRKIATENFRRFFYIHLYDV